MDYAARKLPEIFKPLIDAALLRIAHAAGADTNAVQERLDELVPKLGLNVLHKRDTSRPWHYLRYQATPAIADLILTDRFNEALGHHYTTSLLNGAFGEYLETADWVTTKEELDDERYWDSYPVVLEYFPPESHECLKQGYYVDGVDGTEVLALWDRGDRHSVCRVLRQGFFILGEDSVDWIEKIATEVEKKLASGPKK